jgi:hypothetical protein
VTATRTPRRVIRRGDVTYVYNGSLTVNVWRAGTNFDAFTLDDDPVDIIALRAVIDEHHAYAIEADYRYTRDGLTRQQLLYG